MQSWDDDDTLSVAEKFRNEAKKTVRYKLKKVYESLISDETCQAIVSQFEYLPKPSLYPKAQARLKALYGEVNLLIDDKDVQYRQCAILDLKKRVHEALSSGSENLEVLSHQLEKEFSDFKLFEQAMVKGLTLSIPPVQMDVEVLCNRQQAFSKMELSTQTLYTQNKKPFAERIISLNSMLEDFNALDKPLNAVYRLISAYSGQSDYIKGVLIIITAIIKNGYILFASVDILGRNCLKQVQNQLTCLCIEIQKKRSQSNNVQAQTGQSDYQALLNLISKLQGALTQDVKPSSLSKYPEKRIRLFKPISIKPLNEEGIQSSILRVEVTR